MPSLHRRAIVIFPPSPDMVGIESLRRRFDPVANSIAAHITLVFPFESDISTAELRTHIEHATNGFRRFTIGLDEVTVAEGEYLFAKISQGRNEIVELHDRLYAGPLSGHLTISPHYVPHVTIGRVSEPQALREGLASALAARLKVETSADSVSVYSFGPAHKRHVELDVGLA